MVLGDIMEHESKPLELVYSLDFSKYKKIFLHQPDLRGYIYLDIGLTKKGVSLVTINVYMAFKDEEIKPGSVATVEFGDTIVFLPVKEIGWPNDTLPYVSIRWDRIKYINKFINFFSHTILWNLKKLLTSQL